MLDPKSLVVSGNINNLTPVGSGTPTPPDTAKLKFLSPSLSGLLSSARVTIEGVEVSSCDYIARTEHVMSLLQSDDVRRGDFNSGFGLTKATVDNMHGRYSTLPIQGSITERRVAAEIPWRTE